MKTKISLVDKICEDYASDLKSGRIGKRIQANLDVTKNAVRLRFERRENERKNELKKAE